MQNYCDTIAIAVRSWASCPTGQLLRIKINCGESRDPVGVDLKRRRPAKGLGIAGFQQLVEKGPRPSCRDKGAVCDRCSNCGRLGSVRTAEGWDRLKSNRRRPRVAVGLIHGVRRCLLADHYLAFIANEDSPYSVVGEGTPMAYPPVKGLDERRGREPEELASDRPHDLCQPGRSCPQQ